MKQLITITFILFGFNAFTQLNLPLKFQNSETKWAELSWIEGNKIDDQWFEMRVPPIIVEDTMYVFMNYRGLFDNGVSVGYCGYTIKKLNKNTGEVYWETRRVYKEFLKRKALSQPSVVDGQLVVTIYDEAEQPLGPGTEWNFCYPAEITLDLQSGEIVDSNYVDKINTFNSKLRSIAGITKQNGDNNPKIYKKNSLYDHIIYKAGAGFFEKTQINFDGVVLKIDSIEFDSKFLMENLRYFDLIDGNKGAVMVSQSENWKNKEVIIGIFDSEMQLLEKYDITQHFKDTIGFCVGYRYDNGYFITESGIEDFGTKTLRLTYHMFDMKANLIDKITYTLRDGIDNGIMYGYFYPMADVINNRILLSRCRQDKITESTYYDLFASEGDTISLVKRTLIEGTKDHFRTEYASMMENGDILLYIQQFIWTGTGFGSDYPRFYSWVLLDGQKMNILSSVLDASNDININIYPNPTSHLINIDDVTRFDQKVSLTSISGHVQQLILQEGQIDVSALTSGIYIIALTEATSGKIYRQKIIKID